MRSRAAAQLALALKTPGRLQELADACAVKGNTVTQWALGRRTPSADAQAILAEWGITDSWAEAAIAAEPTIVLPPREPPTEATARTTEQDALALRGLILQMRDHIQVLVAGRDLEAAIRLGEKVVGMLDSLGKLTGATEMNERKIVRTPAFERVWRMLCEAATDATRAYLLNNQPPRAEPLVAAIFRAWAAKLEEIETT